MIIFSSFLQAAQEVKVFVNEQTNRIHYDGPHTEQGILLLKTQFIEEGDRINWLDIKSVGGEINLGMELGEFIFKHQINVAVNEYCYSSCANYIFTSAKLKELGKHGLVGFHGGASSQSFNYTQIEQRVQEFPEEQQSEIRKQMLQQLSLYLEKAKSREANFFNTISVNQAITTLGQAEKYKRLYDPENYIGWYYSVEDLQKLRVTNVTVIAPPWEPRHLPNDAMVFQVKVES